MGEPERAPAEQGYRLAVLQPGTVFPERVWAEVPERATAAAGPAAQGRGVSDGPQRVPEEGRNMMGGDASGQADPVPVHRRL